MLERGQAVLAQQPFSVLLGAELTVFREGEAELALPVRTELRQQHGFVHGGVLAYLADNALTYAAGSLFGDALTLEMKINYARPARGTRLVARAHVVHAGKRQAVVRCDVFDLDEAGERLCAIAQGTITRVEPKP
ncbi:MAG TPA: PaaI family thioesterase [Polyangiales bacterium]|nr:PaaI family thioesterase [Polyangiales bacterium]